MRPWEAYGTSDDAAPEVRVCLDASEEWNMPDDEIHQGVTSIKIMIHGDDPSSAFIHVYGVRASAVRTKWLNAQAVWSNPSVRDLIWGPQ